MTEAKAPPMYYVVFFETKYRSLAEVMEKAPEVLRSHVTRSKQFHAEGKMLMAGAFLDGLAEPVSTMGVLVSREAAEEFANGDPFLLHGMVSTWHIREWSNMFAS